MIQRFVYLIAGLLLTSTMVNVTSSAVGTSASFVQADILIVHGKLVDGSGRKPREADVAIRGDRIVFVGDAHKANISAARTIDATGRIVAPGFIDSHTHTLGDLSNEQTKS